MLLRSYYGPSGSAHWKHARVFKKEGKNNRTARETARQKLKRELKWSTFKLLSLWILTTSESGATGMQEHDLLSTSIFCSPSISVFFSDSLRLSLCLKIMQKAVWKRVNLWPVEFLCFFRPRKHLITCWNEISKDCQKREFEKWGLDKEGTIHKQSSSLTLKLLKSTQQKVSRYPKIIILLHFLLYVITVLQISLR